ncbi:unnamed protein product, partial [Porites evermanni]
KARNSLCQTKQRLQRKLRRLNDYQMGKMIPFTVAPLLLVCFTIAEGGIPKCQTPLGMQNGAIQDAQIKASSEWDGNHAAIQGRLHFKAIPGKAGSWSARSNDMNQWLQIDLANQHTKVTRIATQGRNAYNQWVTKYKLLFSDNGVNFHYYKEQGNVAIK